MDAREIDLEKIGNAPDGINSISSEPRSAVEQMLSRIERGVSGERLGVDHEPWLTPGSEHVAGMKVCCEQHVAIRAPREKFERAETIGHELSVIPPRFLSSCFVNPEIDHRR